MKRVQPSIAVFALVLIGIGFWGFAQFSFVAIWAPGIHSASLRLPVVVACSLISIIGGAGLFVARYARLAALLLSLFLGLWLIWCKGIALIHHPGEFASWESVGETAVVASAAWALAALGDKGATERHLNRIGELGPRLLYGCALILFGISHLAYVTLTASLVPSWLPWHVLWVYLTAATYIAAGTALVTGRVQRPAALLAAIQMLAFSVLVWLPQIAAGARDTDTLNETALSFALAASGWVLASVIGRSGTALVASGPGSISARTDAR